MNQLIAVAFGGALGAVFRYLISTGVYQWLGRDFPYGTLTVNIIGSFLIGLMTEALILQKIALSMEFRSVILVGLFGSLTTFSTFSLDTFYLIEQGQYSKASLNMVMSVFVCVMAVWIGIMLGKTLFENTGGIIRWMSWDIPYGLFVVNSIGAFLIGLLSSLLLNKAAISAEHSSALIMVLAGMFLTFSSMYLVHFYIEQGHSVETYFKSISSVVICNIFFCSVLFWMGTLLGKQV